MRTGIGDMSVRGCRHTSGTFSLSVCDEAASVVTVRFVRGTVMLLHTCKDLIGLKALLNMFDGVVGILN